MDHEHLAARVFLIAHDEFSGRPHLGHELLACGLVGAQLAELTIAGRLAVSHGRVLVVDASPTDEDDIGSYVVDAVAGQQATHTVRTWTANLGDPLHDLVGRRLVDEGVLRRQSVRGLLGHRPDRFPAVDLLRAAAPRVHLEHMIRRPRDLDLAGGVVLALLWSIGAERILDPTIDRTEARELVEEVREHLPPDLAELLTGVTSAVSAISLTVRR